MKTVMTINGYTSSLRIAIWSLLCIPALLACTDVATGSSSSFACGEEWCEPEEFCLVQQGSPVPSGTSSIEDFACIAIPDNVDRDKICSAITTWGGLPVTACSNLGGPELQTTDVTCGDRLCTKAEYCQVITENGWGSPIEQLECVALPSGCTASFTWCESACRETAELATDLPSSLCIASDQFLFLFF